MTHNPQPFTYDWYRHLIDSLLQNGYNNISYSDGRHNTPSFILRHDVDNSLPKAVTLAQIENELHVRSTYFILLRSDFYNIASKHSLEMIDQIISLGHSIGLHFDEAHYDNMPNLNVPDVIMEECWLMGKIIGVDVTSVSMHRPSRETLEADYIIPGIINSYGNKYFKEFKYLSDSRRRWREPVMDIIKSRVYDNLHILTHPIWYNRQELNIKETLSRFIQEASVERYETEKDNITDLDEILKH